MKQESRSDVREAIMAAGRSVVQKDGFNALSFRDLASEVGVKSSSVHHYFPTKGDLGEALASRYCEDLSGFLETLSEKSFDDAIDAYVGLFRSFFDECNQMCLGGMMSAEISALTEPVRMQVERLVKRHTDWLSEVLLKKHPRMPVDKREARARAIFCALEGAQLIARGHGGDAAYYDTIVDVYKTTGLIG